MSFRKELNKKNRKEKLYKKWIKITDKIDKENNEIIEYNKNEEYEYKHKKLISKTTIKQDKRSKNNIEKKEKKKRVNRDFISTVTSSTTLCAAKARNTCKNRVFLIQ